MFDPRFTVPASLTDHPEREAGNKLELKCLTRHILRGALRQLCADWILPTVGIANPVRCQV